MSKKSATQTISEGFVCGGNEKNILRYKNVRPIGCNPLLIILYFVLPRLDTLKKVSEFSKYNGYIEDVYNSS
jgi:hypothetical protein